MGNNQSTSSSSTSLRICKTKPRMFFNISLLNCKNKKSLISQLNQYKQNKCVKVVQTSKFSRGTLSSDNGFVHTVLRCYSGHHNMIIRPDDVWTAIMTQFSFFINEKAEKLRAELVNCEGTKQLEFVIPESLHSARYDLLVNRMAEKIEENLIDKEFRDWIFPNFTTTTKDDIITAGVLFTATIKKYTNKKKFACTSMSEIPWITLEGTLQDWQDVCERFENLKLYDVDEWCEMLEPILKHFLEAKKGIVNLKFWQSICHKEKCRANSDYIDGWLSVFCVFNERGKWQGFVTENNKWPKITMNSIPSGIAETDVTIVDANGKEHNSVMIAGHLGLEVHKGCTTLKPRVGWAICVK